MFFAPLKFEVDRLGLVGNGLLLLGGGSSGSVAVDRGDGLRALGSRGAGATLLVLDVVIVDREGLGDLLLKSSVITNAKEMISHLLSRHWRLRNLQAEEFLVLHLQKHTSDLAGKLGVDLLNFGVEGLAEHLLLSGLRRVLVGGVVEARDSHLRGSGRRALGTALRTLRRHASTGGRTTRTSHGGSNVLGRDGHLRGTTTATSLLSGLSLGGLLGGDNGVVTGVGGTTRTHLRRRAVHLRRHTLRDRTLGTRTTLGREVALGTTLRTRTGLTHGDHAGLGEGHTTATLGKVGGLLTRTEVDLVTHELLLAGEGTLSSRLLEADLVAGLDAGLELNRVSINVLSEVKTKY